MKKHFIAVRIIISLFGKIKNKKILLIAIISLISLLISCWGAVNIFCYSSKIDEYNMIFHDQPIKLVSYDISSYQDSFTVEGTFENTKDIFIKDTIIEIFIYSSNGSKLIGTATEKYTDISNSDLKNFVIHVDRIGDSNEWGTRSNTEIKFHNTYTLPID